MTDVSARGPVKRIQIEATVIRADGTRVELGTVSDSAWSFYDPRSWFAAWRIGRANRQLKEE